METIVLNILSQDVRESSYMNSTDCPITRAFKRAGYPELRDTGTGINKDTELVHVYSDQEMTELGVRVIGMYITLGIMEAGTYYKPMPVEDFTYTLNINYEKAVRVVES